MIVQSDKNELLIGVISDTHGLLRPEVISNFKGVDYILHAGDIGSKSILEQLENIAPVVAVTGNTDNPVFFPDLYETAILDTGKKVIYLIHNINELDLDPVAAGISVVVYGHSHKASAETKNGVLFFNPGSAGPRRLNLPVSLGFILIKSNQIETRVVDLLATSKDTSAQ